MWISKKRYEALCEKAVINENNAQAADSLRRLKKKLREEKNSIIFDTDFVAMSREVYYSITNESSSNKDEIKDIAAELEWYKVKYHEMKMSRGKK